MKKIMLTVFSILASQLVFGQYMGPHSVLTMKGKRNTPATKTRTSALETQIDQRVIQAVSISSNDPRQIKANGQTYHLRHGESFYRGTEKIKGISYARGGVYIRTYTNGQDIIQVYKIEQLGNAQPSEDDYITEKQSAFDRDIRGATHQRGCTITAKELLVEGSSYMEACEMIHSDGSRKYIVKKVVENPDDGAEYGLIMKKNIPAKANAAQMQGATYQTVRKTDIPKTFGKVFTPYYEGVFGDETYYK